MRRLARVTPGRSCGGFLGRNAYPKFVVTHPLKVKLYVH